MGEERRGRAWLPRGQGPHDLPPWGAQGHVGAIPKQDTAAPIRQLVAEAVLAGIIHPLGGPEDGALLSWRVLHGWAQRRGELSERFWWELGGGKANTLEMLRKV